MIKLRNLSCASILLLASFAFGNGKKLTFESLQYSGFLTIERFALIDVEVSGSAEKLGLKEDKLTDQLRLRFKNNFAGMEFKEPDSLVRILLNPDSAQKYGSLHVAVWTVGDDYPVAFHIEITSGNLADTDQYKRAMLGYGSKKDVPATIRKQIEELVEDAAVVFFKARGEL